MYIHEKLFASAVHTDGPEIHAIATTEAKRVGAIRSQLTDTISGVVSRKCARALCAAGICCTMVAADATPAKFTRVDR
jgi:hypothetical protein